MLNRIFAWLWNLLPDRCEMSDCTGRGIRGNENVINDKRVCDYCHAKIMRIARADGE